MDGLLGKMTVTLPLSAEEAEALDKVAAHLQRDRDWVILHAVRYYLEAEGAEVLDEAEGLAELERGEGIDFDEAMGSLREIIRSAEAKQAAKKTGT